jgi:hypothetical protein
MQGFCFLNIPNFKRSCIHKYDVIDEISGHLAVVLTENQSTAAKKFRYMFTSSTPNNARELMYVGGILKWTVTIKTVLWLHVGACFASTERDPLPACS